MLLSVACGMQSRYTARPRGFLLPRALATTPGINRRPNAGGGIDCAEGDSGPPRDASEPSWARPCEASGALYLSNGGSGGGHAACTLWPPPAPFGYFPARGKYLVRPQAGETSHKKHIPCGGQGKRAFLAFPFCRGFRTLRVRPKGFPIALWTPSGRTNVGEISHKEQFLMEGRGKERCPFFLFRRGFRLCGGDQRAFRSPSGHLRGPLDSGRNLSQDNTIPYGGQGERALPFLPVSQGISPLRRRPKGFPIALWKPSG